MQSSTIIKYLVKLSRSLKQQKLQKEDWLVVVDNIQHETLRHRETTR